MMGCLFTKNSSWVRQESVRFIAVLVDKGEGRERVRRNLTLEANECS